MVIIAGRLGSFYIWTSLRLIFSQEFDFPFSCWDLSGKPGRKESADLGPLATGTTGDNGKASDSLEIIFQHQHQLLHTIPTTSLQNYMNYNYV